MSAWVLLRGLARERRHWGSFPAVLQRALPPGSAIITLDLPGNGMLHALRSPARIEAMVADYRRQLLDGGVQGPWVLLGLSMGAMVAAEWATRHPGELRACILANGSAASLSPPWQRLRPASWPALLEAARPGRSVLRRERALLAVCSQHAPPGTAARWTALAQQCPVRTVNAARQLLAALRYRFPAQPPPVPVLVVASMADRLVDPRCSAALARAWGAPQRSHPTAGHEIALDAPAWLARVCAGFLRETEGGPRPAG